MNILIDCLSLMTRNGAAEYLRRVIEELLQSGKNNRDVVFYGVYDSRHGIAYDDVQPDMMEQKGFVKMVDIANSNLVDIVDANKIDTFFIGCVQVLENYKELADLQCRVVVVAHDLSFEEIHRDDIDIYWRVQNKSTASLINWLLLHKKKSRTKSWHIFNTVKLMERNSKAIIIAVSNYTKNTILYAYNLPEERIHVLYSPERVYNGHDGEVENLELRSLIDNHKPFFMLLGTQHPLKNTRKAINAFRRFAELYPDYYLVTAGKMLDKQFVNHVPLSYLSEHDLQKAYQSCHALIYPTLFEGFGYPPVEVMRYSKPVLSSNVGAVREVLADAPIYFSPLYEADIFQALCSFVNTDYSALQAACRRQYEKISIRQHDDLMTLLNLILCK